MPLWKPVASRAGIPSDRSITVIDGSEVLAVALLPREQEIGERVRTSRLGKFERVPVIGAQPPLHGARPRQIRG